MTTDAATTQGPRGARGLLVSGSFAAIFWGRLSANTGAWMHSVVAAIVVYASTDSAAAVSLVSIAQFTPQLLFAPLCGAWADRGHLIQQMIIGRSLCVLGSGGLAVLLLFSWPAGLTVWWVFVSSLVVGIGFVVDGPALQTVVPALIRPGELRSAMLLNTLPTTLGRIIGPVLGAFAVVHLSASAAFAASAVLHGVLLVIIALITVPKTASGLARTTSTSVRAGLGYLRHQPALVLALVATVAVGAGCEPTLTLGPALADKLGGGEQLVGFLTFAFGSGALVGVLIALLTSRWLTVRASAVGGLLMMAVGCGIAGLTGTTALALTAFALMGIGFASGMAGFSTLLQHYTADEYRGRIMALWLMAFVGSRPFAAFAFGVLADLTSVEASFLCAGLAVLLTACICRPSRLRPR